MEQPLCTSDVMAGNSNKNTKELADDELVKTSDYPPPQPKTPHPPIAVIYLQQDGHSAIGPGSESLHHYNGIIDNCETYSTDEELEAIEIENRSKSNLDISFSESSEELSDTDNISVITISDSEPSPQTLTLVEDIDLPKPVGAQLSDKFSTSPLPFPSHQFHSCNFETSSDTNKGSATSSFQDHPVKNQAEHMLHAVREINTPWAKDLEKRLAEEIKFGSQSQRDVSVAMNGQVDSNEMNKPLGNLKSNYQNNTFEMDGQSSRKGRREHENLMKAMVEIGAQWADDIHQMNFLTQRTREKVNYKDTYRKREEPTEKKPNVSNSSPLKPLDSDKKISVKLKKPAVDPKAKIKNDIKVKKTTIVKAKNDAAVKKKIRITVKNVKGEQTKKSLTKDKSKVSKILGKKQTNIVRSNMMLLNSLKKNKTVKVSKNYKLPQTNANKVPSAECSTEKLNSLLMMTKYIANNGKLSKPVKSNIIESNLKNVEKVSACLSNLDDMPMAKQRQSIRQQIHSTVFKEIGVRKHLNFMQITFLNRHNAAYLGVQALKELKNAFYVAKQDPTCRLVLLNGSGRVFCSGIDLSSICNRDNQKNITELTIALRDFLKYMLIFPKPIIAGVNGSAVGLGATMLPICDLVYASDKATFSTPYVKLSQVPEGGASFSFTQILGPAIASDMLLNGRVLTAQEACQYGLVSQVMWPSQFMETLFPKVLNLASESSQGMEATKQLMKASCKLQLDTHIDKECALLNVQWNSQACQKVIMNAFQNRFHLST